MGESDLSTLMFEVFIEKKDRTIKSFEYSILSAVAVGSPILLKTKLGEAIPKQELLKRKNWERDTLLANSYMQGNSLQAEVEGELCVVHPIQFYNSTLESKNEQKSRVNPNSLTTEALVNQAKKRKLEYHSPLAIPRGVPRFY